MLEEAGEHLTLDEIYRRAVFRDRRIGYGTVRQVIASLVTERQLSVVDSGDGRLRYHVAGGEQMGCVFDVESGAIVTFRSAEFEQMVRTVLADMGYDLRSYSLRLMGRRRHADIAAE